MIRWLTAFIDMPAAGFERGAAFWEAVTGCTRSVPRGAGGEFATLVPPHGEAMLKLQRLHDGPARVHLDVHVDDPRAAAARAVELGASVVADHGYVVMSSPGGFVFCLVSHVGSGTGPAPFDAGGGPTLVDQLCIDAAPDRYDTEAAFWAAFTGWPRTPNRHAEYEHIIGPGVPLRLLTQRRDDGEGEAVIAHLDIACGHAVDSTLEQHRALGATVDHTGDGWITMIDPAGQAYCLVRREPSATG